MRLLSSMARPPVLHFCMFWDFFFYHTSGNHPKFQSCKMFFLNVHPMYVQPEKSTWAATWQNQQNECAPSEDSDQPGHPPSLIRVFAVRMKKAWVLSCPLSAKRRLWSDWADAQADLSLRWAHTNLVCFVMSWLTFMLWCQFLQGGITLTVLTQRSGL